MQNQTLKFEQQEHIHWGHFGLIMASAFLLLGISYIKKPEMFKIQKVQVASSDANVPRYYAYVPPQEDLPKSAVLGASTNQGPSIITDDGEVRSVDLEQVLGASTEDVVLSLDKIHVNTLPDSNEAIKNYFVVTKNLEGSIVSDTEFASALNSGNQIQINEQADKFFIVLEAEKNMSVPNSLVRLHKLKIIQYTSAVTLLTNFTNAASNPQQVALDLQQFIKSQQDLDTENAIIATKFGNLNPAYSAYLDSTADSTSSVAEPLSTESVSPLQ